MKVLSGLICLSLLFCFPLLLLFCIFRILFVWLFYSVCLLFYCCAIVIDDADGGDGGYTYGDMKKKRKLQNWLFASSNRYQYQRLKCTKSKENLCCCFFSRYNGLFLFEHTSKIVSHSPVYKLIHWLNSLIIIWLATSSLQLALSVSNKNKTSQSACMYHILSFIIILYSCT